MSASVSVEAEVNYTGAMHVRPQFHANDKALDNVELDARVVRIADARGLGDAPRLDREGFALYEWPTTIADFRDAGAVDKAHPAEIEQLMLELTGADAVAVVGGATLRFGERSQEVGSRDNSHPARLVHIDSSDAAAMDFAKMAEPKHDRPIRRIAQHNIWRAFSGAPQDVPLAVCDARTIAAADLVPADARFDKDGKIVWSFEALLLRYNPSHRWYFFSDMSPAEVIVFKRHDTDANAPHWVAHSAFDDPRVPADCKPRASVEMRTIAYWYA